MKIYIIWLVGVILWNFGYPTAAPILDVIAAIVLSFMSMGMKKIFKILTILRKINILIIRYSLHLRVIGIGKLLHHQSHLHLSYANFEKSFLTFDLTVIHSSSLILVVDKT